MGNFSYKLEDISYPSVEDKTFSYSEIKEVPSNSGEERKIYVWNPDMKEPLTGKGVQEMQKKMVFVFRWLTPYTFEKLFPKKEDLEQVVKGKYGPRTMKMVMTFQSIFMYDQFKSKGFAISSGFGCFGAMTKNVLEEKYIKAQEEAKASNKEIQSSGSEKRKDIDYEYIDYLLKHKERLDNI